MQQSSLSPQLIVALDFADWAATEMLVKQLDPGQCKLKVGSQLFTCLGPKVIQKLTALGFQVFLDLKFHDIPNTVAMACRAAADLGVWMINVHALGGPAMLEAAHKALSDYGANRPILIAVTMLTSMRAADLTTLGLSTPSMLDQVLRLTQLVKESGLDGVVASAQEAAAIRQAQGTSFIIVTPGIRLASADVTHSDDQHRIVTPQDAYQAGADYLVVGRPITQAADPQQAVAQILVGFRDRQSR
ncbi:MAG: orotidine-5'-phosphate decarboxylase [Legionellales bacterium]|nr:orotidine-5'-phosphate decarboxylase [Legionellales bacterium]